MAIQTLDRTRVFGAGLSVQPRPGVLTAFGTWANESLQAMGPFGRRYVLTGLGAVMALGLGASAAAMVRLPSDMAGADQAQDQALAQVELPSVTAARAYALENPPSYMPMQKADDTTTVVDGSTTATDADDSAVVAYTSSDDSAADTKADVTADAATPPATAQPVAAATPAAQTGDGDAN